MVIASFSELKDRLHNLPPRAAVVAAAAHKEGDAHPRPVCNIIFFDDGIIHKCSTRSLISWVLPWFQNWVPM